MKKLTLIRHAAAEAETAHLKDFDRPLSAQGRGEVSAAAARFSAHHLAPELIVTSTARRALETARLFAAAIRYRAGEPAQNERLYLASPSAICAIIRETNDDVAHLAIVAHNPGISELACLLDSEGTQGALSTCGTFTVELKDCDSWVEIASF